jgi:glycosyltransferase involved in cell wall biosynthesis
MNFRLLLVGSEHASRTGGGSITTEILDIVAATGLPDRLIMPGRIPHEEVEAYYSLIDIAPFPRKPQPVTEMVSPMKPLEALAMEKAVIVSSVRALAEMVHHEKTGLVFEKGDIDGLTDALARLIDDPGLRGDLGKAARRWVVEERTWDRTAGLASQRLERLRKNMEPRGLAAGIALATSPRT